MNLTLVLENYEDSKIELDCSDCNNTDIKHTITDTQKRTLDIYINTSAKIAGKKVIFYVKNCVIDNTQQELLFYYSKPSDKQMKMKNLTGMVAGIQSSLMNAGPGSQKKVYMLSDVRQHNMFLNPYRKMSCMHK